MSYCRQCGAELRDGVQFCPACGTPVANDAQQPAQQPAQPFTSYGATMNGADGFDPRDVQQNKVMAILAYFGVLVLAPVFVAKDSKFARFHANQGLILLICEAAYGVIYGIVRSILLGISHHLNFVVGILGLVYLVFVVFAVIGIVSAAGGKAKKLPVIGDYQIIQ